MTSKQRAYLKGLAMTMDPIFQFGKNSLTPENTAAIAEALEARELIKISVLNNCADDPGEIAQMVAERTRSQVVQVIGKKIVLYKEGKDYVMMDNETYEQIQLTEDQVGDGIKYLKENMIVQVLKHDTRIIGVDIPAHVELEVVDTPPAEKGNTAQGGTKPATLETGAVVQVPFFVSNGDVIRVDTRSNEYLDRC